MSPSKSSTRFLIGTQRGQFELELYFSVLPNEAVKRVIIVCHGHERDASAILSQAYADCPDRTSCLIIAPRFYNGLDKDEYHRDPRGTEKLLVWKGNNWGEGGASQYPRGSDLSSFQVLDALVGTHGSRDRYPRLEHVVVAGHSLGGQLVQRYAILGQAQCQVPMSYVVMNPSTYLYPTGDQEYKYGLRNMQNTLSCYPPAFVNIEQLQRQISTRRVHYLQGTADKGVGDERPEAMKQGRDRQQRYQNWKTFLERSGLAKSVTFAMIPHAGHDAGQMMASSVARQWIFEEV